MNKIPIIVIGGPTASGKTSLSIEIAKMLESEIVSCDSMQIYKYMNIGTAKPDMEERSGIVHHMLDIIEPDEPYSVADYVIDAHKAIEKINKKGKVPVAVGGTGLYINSLINDVDFRDDDSDMNLRKELEEIEKEKGIDYLVEMLKSFDAVSAERIHKNNKRRIIRAIEFYKMTGVPISEHQEETTKKVSRYNPCMMAIKWDMQKLYERIEKRVDIMLDAGLVDEVKGLCEKGYADSMLSMQGIGYKEIIAYLNGEVSLDEAIYNIKIGTRHYAKRQMTWFNKDERINWIKYDEDILKKAKEIISSWGGV